MPRLQKITPCLWFDGRAEEAAEHYVSIFPNSRILDITRYREAGHGSHARPAGSVMTVSFELDGHGFTALNGGPEFQFNEAVSFQVNCETQEEVDRYWERLAEGGDPKAQQCGWLKDRFGVSWQVIPTRMIELVNDPDPERSSRVRRAMMKMKKLDLDELRRARGE